MASVLLDFEYDIFISYRHKDNKGEHWVTEFVDVLKTELEATFKEDISIYFDENPHDGLVETYVVDKSLEGKLKCLVFIPILSQTYCDPNSYAWKQEFCVFNSMALSDAFGRDIKLSNGNIACRIIPVAIHDLDPADQSLFEQALHTKLRPIEFIFKSLGVNRPLRRDDKREENTGRLYYPDQINKVANRIKEVILGMKYPDKKITTSFREQSIAVTNRNPKQSIRLTIAILATLLVMVISFGFYYYYSSSESEKSIAVLPLDNLTGLEENLYFVEGMQDALIGQLGKIGSIRVISRTSTLRYQNTTMLLQDIARELGVTNIVEGSVYGVGDSLRIMIQLIEVFPKERHLWAEEYYDRMDKVLAVQTAAVRDITRNINATLSPKEKVQLSNPRKVNPETYKAYLRGMYNLKKGTEEGFETGMNYLLEAIDNDPADPMAYAGVALGYAAVGHGGLSAEDAFNRAHSSAMKALEIDSTSAIAYTALALLYLYDSWEWEKAKKEFENSIKVNPSNEMAHAQFAWYHVLFGDTTRTLYHAKRAIEIDPFSAAYNSWLAWLYYYYKDYEQAELYAAKSLSLQKDLPYGNLILGLVYLQQGREKEAIELHERLPQRDGMFANLGYTYIQTGHRDKALELWNNMNVRYKNNEYVDIVALGMLGANLGFYDEAFQLLNKAVDTKSYPIAYIDVMPGMQDLHTDTRYHKLLEKMNLPVPSYGKKTLTAELINTIPSPEIALAKEQQ